MSTSVDKPLSHENVNKTALKAWSSTSVSGLYEKVRPQYNIDSVEFLLEKVGALKTHCEPFTIVELGAGTGKFTRAALTVFEKRSVKNVKIISTEPLKAMCGKFREALPNTEIIQRGADDLGFASNSADAVLAGECLHWFSNAESFGEIHRVLKPKGFLGMIWNDPDLSLTWIKALMDIISWRYRKRGIPYPYIKDWHLKIEQDGGFGSLKECEESYKSNVELDLEGVLELYSTFSLVSAADDVEKEDILSQVVKVMESHPEVKDKEKYPFQFAPCIEWVQKLDSYKN